MLLRAPLSEVFQVSEGREGVVVVGMMESGRFILPYRHGSIVPSKPPMFHWLSVLLAPLDPAYQEFGLRLPSVLAAIGVLLFSCRLAGALFGPVARLYGGLVLLTTYGFLHLSADGRVDMVFCFFITAALTLWIQAAADCVDKGLPLTRISKNRSRLIALSAGCAMLSKGPLGFALILAIIAAIAGVCWGADGLRALRRREWGWAFAVSVPWYLAALFIGRGPFFLRQVVFENVSRLFGGTGISKKPPWYYLEHIWGQAAPWSLLLVALIAVEWRAAAGQQRKMFSWLNLQHRERFAVRALVVWMFMTVLLISLSAGKRRAYLLPILPALAVLGGLLLSRLQPFFHKQYSWLARYARAGLWLTVLLAALMYLALPLSAFGVTPALLGIQDSSVTLENIWPAIFEKRWYFFPAGIFAPLLTAGLFWYAARRHSTNYAAWGAVSLLLMVFYLCIPFALVTKARAHSYKRFAAELAAVLPEGEVLHFIKRPREESFDGFFFYYRKPLVLHPFSQQPTEPGWYMARRRWFAKQDPKWQQQVTISLTGGRDVDTPEEQLLLLSVPGTNAGFSAGGMPIG